MCSIKCFLVCALMSIAFADKVSVCKFLAYPNEGDSSSSSVCIQESEFAYERGTKGSKGSKGEAGSVGQKGGNGKANETEINKLESMIKEVNQTQRKYHNEVNDHLEGLKKTFQDFACLSNPCVNGNCSVQNNSYSCSCNPGYSGKHCEIYFACLSNPCVNGNCSVQNNSYSCSCNPGYSGKHCKIYFACLSNPCVNGNCSVQNNSYSCSCNPGYSGKHCEIINSFPTSCSDLTPNYGVDASGIYVIQPFDNSTRIPVYCDLHTDGGGWMIFQRRLDGSENFFRNFSDYVRGFGKLTGEFWLGLNVLHEITKNGDYELRVDMADFENQTRYAVYRNFTIGSGTNYTLTISEYQGTAGNGILSGARFSARDFDQDTSPTGSCSQLCKGGWWYTACHRANPNGLYLRGSHTSYADGVNWLGFRGNYYSLKTIEMKLRKKRI